MTSSRDCKSWSKSTTKKYDVPSIKPRPVELVKKCVLASSNPENLVVDPFGGSGTTYAVSEAFGRKWLGTESNLNYCEIIKERLADQNHISRIISGKDELEAIQRRKKLRVQ